MNKLFAFGTVMLFALPQLAKAENITNNTAVSLLDSSRVHDIDEVIVVSRPKDHSILRRQSVSSSSFSGIDMQKIGAKDLRDLSLYVPSFTMPSYGSRYTSSVYMRGIGSRINNPAVGIYIDDMPLLSKSTYNHHTYQLSMVDVLRGPQGTLYGQNTEGGIIRMYTLNPMSYQGTDITLGGGSHGYRNAEVMHYGKLSDKFAFSLGGFYTGENGFFRNLTTGERADKYNEAGGRMKLVFRPDNRWDVNFIADYQYTRQNGFPYGLMNPASGDVESTSTTYQSNYRRNMLNAALNLKFRGNYFDFFSTSSYQYLKDYMFMDQDYLPEDYMHLTQRQFQNAFSQEFVLKGNQKSFYHWQAGAFFSAQWMRTDAPVYFGEAITGKIGGAIQNAMYTAMVNSMAARMAQGGMPMAVAKQMAEANIAKAGGVTMSVDMAAPGIYHTPQYNLGFFHESSFDITDRLTATIGARFDYQKVKLDYDASAYMSMTANVMKTVATYVLRSAVANKMHENFNQFLPKFALNYKVGNDGSNIYATVSKGYRAGGFNFQMFSDILQTDLNANQQKAMRSSYDVEHTAADYENMAKTITYKPETSWNYEAGAHLNLFDNKLHWDIAAYYMQVRNQQLSVMAGDYGFGRRMVNAGKSYSCGIETSLRGNAVNNHLSWALSYSYTHAVFDEYSDTITVGTEKTFVDYKDKKVPYVPQHSLAAMIDYRFDFNGSFLHALTIGANMNAQGKTYWDEENTYSQKFYAVMGAHVDADFGNITLSVWGKNLTDKKYNTFAFGSSAAGAKQYFAQRANPFQIGVEAKLHF